jgi:Zn-dependent metalloprotease
MIRKILFVALLAVAIAAVVIFPFTRSDASRSLSKKVVPTEKFSRARPLPNYDIRLVNKGEFVDYDLNSAADRQSAAQNVAAQARSSAVDRFRSKLSPEGAANLRATINETGGVKNLFIYGATLSEARSDTADNIARGFLNRNEQLFALRSAAEASLRLINDDRDRGTEFLEYAQMVGGLKVFDGQVQVVVNKNGEVVSVREGFLIDGQSVDLNPGFDEVQGIRKGFAYAGRRIDSSLFETRPRIDMSERAAFANPLGTDLEDVTAELNVFRVGNSARLAWHVYAEVGQDEWYELLVDAHNGELLLRHNLYVFDAQGTVYTEDPSKGARQLVSFVGDTAINTAAGWMGTSTVTTGNNVEAYLDTNADNAPDNNNGSGLSQGHASSATQDFTFPFSTAVDPRTQQAAVVTNLFYFNNIMHDFSYTLGFTETARNFQTDNYGRGGIGADSVRAEAQDGSGTNNANFATPPDGSRPRMQQYLFTSPNPDRDSSVDGDVVFHEFGHGISNRLIGNGSATALGGTQSGAMGEGWSDYWAITINGDGAVGEYVTNNPIGIRRAAYSVPAATVHDSYADVCFRGCEVHKDGEVWAATLWDLRAQLGAATTDLLVLNGMKFTPTQPSFLDARDGILQADQNLNGGANRCAIWVVFARHGMGVSASGNDGHKHNAATDVPPGC